MTPASSVKTESDESYVSEASSSNIQFNEVVGSEAVSFNSVFHNTGSNTDEFGSSLADEGHIQNLKYTMEKEALASKNILACPHPKPELFKLCSKSLTSMNSPFTSLVQDVNFYHPTSPLLRKLVFCQATIESSDILEIVSSVTTTGFATALSLEYSNIEIQNKACVDYKKHEKILLTHKIAKSIANNSAIWLSCGFEHCALITCEGKVMTWGYGSSGCLGHGNTNSYGFPKIVSTLSFENFKYIECGGYHTLAINESSELYMWGRGDVNQLGLSHRQLSKDEYGCVALQPVKLDYFTKKIKGGACGEAHTLIVDEDGNVFSFGWGEDGQLGISNTEGAKYNGITKIEFFFESSVIKVAAGQIFSACLTEKGDIFVWGNGEKGQFGRAIETEFISTPQKIGISNVIDIVCGESCVICVTEAGCVYGWGLGKAGYFSSQIQNFMFGSDLICFTPKLLGEADIIHHYML